MSVETIQMLSAASFILAGILLATTIILFFALRIREAFGFLTGRTRKKAIARIRENNEHSKENVVLSERKNKIVTSSLIDNKKYSSNGTMLLSQDNNKNTTLLSQEYNSGTQTTLLAQNCQSENRYIIQNSTVGVTTDLLNLNAENEEIEYEIIFMESTEIIS